MQSHKNCSSHGSTFQLFAALLHQQCCSGQQGPLASAAAAALTSTHVTACGVIYTISTVRIYCETDCSRVQICSDATMRIEEYTLSSAKLSQWCFHHPLMSEYISERWKFCDVLFSDEKDDCQISPACEHFLTKSNINIITS